MSKFQKKFFLWAIKYHATRFPVIHFYIFTMFVRMLDVQTYSNMSERHANLIN